MLYMRIFDLNFRFPFFSALRFRRMHFRDKTQHQQYNYIFSHFKTIPTYAPLLIFEPLVMLWLTTTPFP